MIRAFFFIITKISALSVPYYYNPNIHNFGNIGIGGKIHAELGPLFTKFIDNIRYNGTDIRKEILEPYKNKNIIDLCCGTGISTLDGNVGIDTSKEMLSVAKKYKNKSRFLFGNAEVFGKKNEFDIVTCMFSFHEMPNYAHKNIIENSKRIAKEEILIVDISPNYIPSKIMLSGEPYILNYLDTIDDILIDFEKTDYIKDRVCIWKYKL